MHQASFLCRGIMAGAGWSFSDANIGPGTLAAFDGSRFQVHSPAFFGQVQVSEIPHNPIGVSLNPNLSS